MTRVFVSKCQWRCDHCDHLYDEKKGCGDECAPPHEKAIRLLRELQPYLDSIICYASTISEYRPNGIVKEINDLLEICK